MSAPICPNGHTSIATDYCDTCGAPMPTDVGGSGGALAPPTPAIPGPAAAAAAPGAPGAASVQVCPNCQTPNVASALFCEACGYDFTTGAMPRTAAPVLALVRSTTTAPTSAATTGDPAPLAPAVPVDWVVEVWVDPDWYAAQDCDEACPSPGLPRTVPLAVRSVLVGRTSASRSIHPEVDCDGDIGVSRRQAQLTTDGTRWWVEDLQSSNGTYIGEASGPLPSDALAPGQRRELAEGDRVYVGAWTRLVVRRATDDEKAGRE